MITRSKGKFLTATSELSMLKNELIESFLESYLYIIDITQTMRPIGKICCIDSYNAFPLHLRRNDMEVIYNQYLIYCYNFTYPW